MSSEASGTGAATDAGTTTAATDASSSTGDSETSGGSSSTNASGSTTAEATSTTGTETSGSSGSTGEARGDQWADVQLTYAGDGVMESVVLDDCTFCDATIDSGVALIRFQQAEGWTVWSIYLPASLGPGTHTLTPDGTGAYVVISENNPDLPPAVHGFYPFSSNVGTVTLAEADLSRGGTVTGTIATQLSLGGITATFDAEFTAVLSAL